MGVNEIVTVGHLEKLQQELLQSFQNMLVNKQTKPETEEDKYLSIGAAADFTGHGRSTVERWLKLGKKDKDGKMVKLPYKLFSPNDYRILKSDLVAFGSIGIED